MVDQLVAELARDVRLQPFDIFRAEFDYFAGAQIDEVIVVRVRALLVAVAALAELVRLDDAGVLEELHGSIHGRNGDVLVDPGTALVELLDVRMVARLGEHARDHAPLPGHAHALGRAKRFDIAVWSLAFVRRWHVSLPPIRAHYHS